MEPENYVHVDMSFVNASRSLPPTRSSDSSVLVAQRTDVKGWRRGPAAAAGRHLRSDSRPKSEALAIEQALSEKGIPHSHYKKDGLYESDEALELSCLFSQQSPNRRTTPR